MTELPCQVRWPENKTFAFTIFDDTDLAAVENVAEIYELLYELGLRTTKSIWIKSDSRPDRLSGQTCDDPEYLEWIYKLQKQGFEIGWHMASYHSSGREKTIAALDRYRQLFESNPASMANHSQNCENIYWGSAKLSNPIYKFIYNLATGFKNHDKFMGHVEGSDYFWGDVCKQRIQYCRGFQFKEINTLKVCPYMPYHDPEKAYVNLWFCASDGAEISSFNSLLSEVNQDKLESEGGACIVYTHLARGFYRDGEFDKRFTELIKRLSEKNGWFVPVRELLDYLAERQESPHTITNSERNRLESHWLWQKLRFGRS
jgi:hypothetical protein